MSSSAQARSSLGVGGGGGGSLVTVTISAGGLDGGGAALVGPAEVAVCGVSVALVLSVALVRAIATPPTAINAMTAASPNINCGNRCQLRGSSIGSVGGTYSTGGRAAVKPVSYRSPVYGTGSSAVSSCDHASARNVADPGSSTGVAAAGTTGATP